MNRVIIPALVIFLLASCGGKNASENESTESTESATASASSPEEMIQQGKTLVDQSDCNTCHHSVNKIVGPSHTEVAQKYDFTEANVDMLADRIIKGGSGNWGEIPMTPHTDLSKDDAKKMAYYVLSLDGESIH